MEIRDIPERLIARLRAWLVWSFIVLATIGLTASLVVHLVAILGSPILSKEDAFLLHLGIFVIWIPGIFLAESLTRDFRRRDYLRAVLRGCPKWMRDLLFVFFGYALVNFALFFLWTFRVPPGNVPEALEFRGFSGHWMAFYAAGIGVFYSFLHVREHERARRCINGHPVSPLAKYCEQCGQPVVDELNRQISGT